MNNMQKVTIKSTEEFNNYIATINNNEEYGIEADKMSFFESNFPEARTEKEAYRQMEDKLPIIIEIDDKGIPRSYKTFNQNLIHTKKELKKHSVALGKKINNLVVQKEKIDRQIKKIDSQIRDLPTKNKRIDLER